MVVSTLEVRAPLTRLFYLILALGGFAFQSFGDRGDREVSYFSLGFLGSASYYCLGCLLGQGLDLGLFF
jgi:hypothetical protein